MSHHYEPAGMLNKKDTVNLFPIVKTDGLTKESTARPLKKPQVLFVSIRFEEKDVSSVGTSLQTTTIQI